MLHKFTGDSGWVLPLSPSLSATSPEISTASLLTAGLTCWARCSKLTQPARRQPFTVSLARRRAGDGAFPGPGIIRDAAGNLYGAASGGAYGEGTVYELSSSGEETLLYSFPGGSDGAQPSSTLLLDSQGNLYGTTQNGGNSECGGTGVLGVVFELSPQSGGGWTEKVLYAFCSLSSCADGDRPLFGPLVMDAAGNLYGTTVFGGNSTKCNGTCGVVFKLDTAGKESVLHNFTGGADGAIPAMGVTLDSSNNLYGTTEEGGDLKCEPKHGGCGVADFQDRPVTETLRLFCHRYSRAFPSHKELPFPRAHKNFGKLTR